MQHDSICKREDNRGYEQNLAARSEYLYAVEGKVTSQCTFSMFASWRCSSNAERNHWRQLRSQYHRLHQQLHLFTEKHVFQRPIKGQRISRQKNLLPPVDQAGRKATMRLARYMWWPPYMVTFLMKELSSVPTSLE